MTPEQLISQAIDDLCRRARVDPDDGTDAARDAVRAVVARDRVDDPDRWQGWFREATGLKVFVSPESVFTVERNERRESVQRAKVELPPAVRNAVRQRGDGMNATTRVKMCRVQKARRATA